MALAVPGVSYAQISSGAFDPHCYQPVIGTPGVIDTIMGAENGQRLGQGLINIGPSPEDTAGPGRLMMYGLPGTLGDTSAALLTVGSNFDPTNINITKMLGFKPQNPVMGYFRSEQFIDMLLTGDNNPFMLPRIYWQKGDGTFDTSNYTTLLPDPRMKHIYVDPLYFEGLNPPYHAHLTSDSTEDIIILTVNARGDSEMACLFRGGSKLFQPGDTILPDAQAFFDSTKNFNNLLTYQGDFRGTGKTDLVVHDVTPNLFFYANNEPFSLHQFVATLKTDTLFAASTDPWFNPRISAQRISILQMRQGGPESLLFYLDSAVGTPGVSDQIRIFLGGPQFGSQRETFEDALTIHSPSYFDGSNFFEASWGFANPIVDCGDVAGIGDHVLCVPGNWAGDGSYFTFYVLGNSFDEKVDMYFAEYPYGGGTIDTATLDGDNLQDIAIGMPAYPDLITNGNQYNGSVLFVHGSHKIPAVNQSVKSAESQQGSLWVAQSKDNRSIMAHLPEDAIDGELCKFIIRDILGRTVFESEERAKESVRFQLPALPEGAYFLEVQAGEKVFEIKLIL